MSQQILSITVNYMYEFLELTSSTAASYQKLTFPMLRSHLSTLAPHGPYLALGVNCQSKPVGLVLAKYSQDKSWADILSLYVEPGHRQQGLGKALLVRMERAMSNSCCSQMNLAYTLNLTTPVLEHLLRQLNWSPACPYTLMCATQKQDIKKVPWLDHYTLPASFTLFPWLELTLQDRKMIQQQRDSVLKYPPELDPFREEDSIEPRSSLGLRYQGQVVGWMITHRIAADTVRYSALFVRPDLQVIGRAIPLLATAIRQQLEDPEVTKGLFIVLVDNTPMVKFVHRRLAPYLVEIRQFWRSTKVLASSMSQPGFQDVAKVA